MNGLAGKRAYRCVVTGQGVLMCAHAECAARRSPEDAPTPPRPRVIDMDDVIIDFEERAIRVHKGVIDFPLDMNRSELQRLRVQIEGEIAGIRDKLALALHKRTLGERPPEPRWVHAALAAKRFRGAYLQQIQARQAELRIEEKRANARTSAAEKTSFERMFFEVVKERMTGAEFKALCDEAERRMERRP